MEGMIERRTTEHWLELDGRRTYYRRLLAGPGGVDRPPLLLIHGIACCTETFAPFLKELGRRADAPAVIVPDLPAHGRTAKAPRVLGMGDFAEWTERFVRQLSLPAVDVLGHSMGGQVAPALAQMHPDTVRRMVLLGPTTGGRHVSTTRNALGLMTDCLREPLSYNLLLMSMFWRMGPLRYLLTVREMQRDDAFLRAREVRAPTLVAQGSRDLIVPKWVGPALAGTFPRGRYVQVPGAPHAAQYSHPSPMADAVLDFLAPGAGAMDLPSPSVAGTSRSRA